MSRSDSRVCSSTIEASFTGVPQRRESNWKSIAQTTFGASASVIGQVLEPARLRLGLRATRNPSSRQIRCTFAPFHDMSFSAQVSPGAPVALTGVPVDTCPFT